MKSYLDDPDDTRYRMLTIRGWSSGVCKIRSNELASTCWCWGAGPNGSNISCPPLAEQPSSVVAEPISNHRLTDPTPVPYRVLP